MFLVTMILEAMILGVLQGVLEWLPISSQGNLVLAMVRLFGLEAEQALNLSVFLHMGTLFAVVVYLRKDILNLIRALPRYRLNYADREGSLISFLLFTTVLTGVVGYLVFRLAHAMATGVGEALVALTGVALIITGLLQRFVKKGVERKSADPDPKDTLLLGVGQGLSPFPGVSRSGITTSFLLFRGFDGKEALRLSFLMSVPSILAAEVGLSLVGGVPPVGATDMLVGVLSSFAFGILSIHTLLRIAERIRFWMFCLLLGILALLPTLFYL